MEAYNQQYSVVMKDVANKIGDEQLAMLIKGHQNGVAWSENHSRILKNYFRNLKDSFLLFFDNHPRIKDINPKDKGIMLSHIEHVTLYVMVRYFYAKESDQLSWLLGTHHPYGNNYDWFLFDS